MYSNAVLSTQTRIPTQHEFEKDTQHHVHQSDSSNVIIIKNTDNRICRYVRLHFGIPTGNGEQLLPGRTQADKKETAFNFKNT